MRKEPSPLEGGGGRRPGEGSMLLGRAKKLRREQTEAERKMRVLLRDRQFAGFKFRRQEPIGPYIVDFCCFDRRLVIELDGGQHHKSDYDAERDAFLKSVGFRVLRFWNPDWFKERDAVLTSIWTALRPPHPSPLPRGGEGR